MVARQQVDHLWRQTGVLRDDIRQSVFPADRTGTGDPTANWDRVSVAVDGDPVEFAVLTEREHWVSQAIIGETVVGIEARNWKLDTTGLVTETNFAAYIEGSQEMRRRMTA